MQPNIKTAKVINVSSFSEFKKCRSLTKKCTLRLKKFLAANKASCGKSCTTSKSHPRVEQNRALCNRCIETRRSLCCRTSNKSSWNACSPPLRKLIVVTAIKEGFNRMENFFCSKIVNKAMSDKKHSENET